MIFNWVESDFLLLSGEDIRFHAEDSDETFVFRPPTLNSLYKNPEINFLLNILEKSIEDLKKDFPFDYDTKYELITKLLLHSKKNPKIMEIGLLIIKSLSLILPGFNFTKVMKINEDIFIEEKTFNNIVKLLFKSMGRKITMIEEDDDEFTRREKQAKLRAEKIKNSKKEESEKNGFEKIIAGISYYFPQYKIIDIFEMNLYTIYYLFKYVGKIANYEVSVIATGNGLDKKNKHKHFIDL